MSSKLKTYLRSGYAALYAVTHEEERVTSELTQLCAEIGFKVFTWTPTIGVVTADGQVIDKFLDKKTTDPIVAVSMFMAADKSVDPSKWPIPEKSVLVLKDFHLYLKKGEAVMTRMVKDAITIGRSTARSLMVMGCQLQLPPELEKEFTVVEFPLPTREELKALAEQLAGDKGVKLNGSIEAIVEAGSGLTTIEFCDAAAASLTERDTIDPVMVAELKAETIKKSGVLEVIKPGVTFDELGGLHDLKGWIAKRKNAFGKKARAYGLPMPKGVILFGVQGGGKSHAVKAIASELGCPLLRLDPGRLFGGLVGQSEANIRAVIGQIEAFGACVLQIDEIDKAGMNTGGHDGDSGTSRRVMGTMLTWMAEKKSPVFIVATANNLSNLPAELLRKGRWDEMFFIDLPTLSERIEIWRVQIKMNGRKPDPFDLEQLALATEHWTGAEIEALFKEGLYAAFEHDAEPDTELLVELSKNTVPLSKTMAEVIDGMRRWADGRCRSASATEKKSTITLPKGRKFST